MKKLKLGLVALEKTWKNISLFPTSLSELVDNISGNFNSIECKSSTENNRCKQCKKLIEALMKKFPSIHQFCDGNLNKFVLLLLRKGAYPHEDMDSWEKINETSLLEKKFFTAT